jgi:transposase-like protein
MKNSNIYADYRYSAQIISHAVWLYHRFTLSFRDIKELIAARGITVSYETIRNWCDKFGQRYCSQIRKKQGQLGDTWYLNEIVSISYPEERTTILRDIYNCSLYPLDVSYFMKALKYV